MTLEEIVDALINNKPVSRWDVLSLRKQVKYILEERQADPDVMHEFFLLIDSAKESL